MESLNGFDELVVRFVANLEWQQWIQGVDMGIDEILDGEESAPLFFPPFPTDALILAI